MMKDILGGVILLISGAVFAYYSSVGLDQGSFRRVGPGMFPLITGLVLAGFGLTQLLLGLTAQRKGTQGADLALPPFPLRPIVMVLLGVIAFGLTIRILGLIPAIFVTVVIASFADRQLRLPGALVLATGLSALCWLIFIVGLGLPIQPFRI